MGWDGMGRAYIEYRGVATAGQGGSINANPRPPKSPGDKEKLEDQQSFPKRWLGLQFAA